MSLADYHVHTRFCDGKNSPEELVRAAIERGLTAIGFSGHSHTAFDESWCMSPAGTIQYRAEIARLKEAYGGVIRIYCGVEQDYDSDAPTDGYDYVIGSVHYLHLGEEYLPVDESPALLRAAAARYFGGDLYGLCEAYYAKVARVVERTGCDLIGHFDLITKFNEGEALFSTGEARYQAAWRAAADALLETGKTFEINTGAIARGYRRAPYPDQEILRYLRDGGARFVLSGDAHSVEGLCYDFPRWKWLLAACE